RTPESGGQAVILVQRSGFGDSAATVQVDVSAGTAVPGVDFAPTTQTVSFAPGQTVASFTVPIGTNARGPNGHTTGNPTLSNPSVGILGPRKTVVLTLGGSSLTADLKTTLRPSATTTTAGGALGFVITVTNDGPSDVTGAQVVDAFPKTLSDVHWTAVAS